MKGNNGWFRQFGYKMRYSLQRFMAGRYGQHDKLNTLILWTGVVLVLLSMFFSKGIMTLLLPVTAYVLLGIAMWRMMSRNTYKRARENRKFLALLARLKDREHRYFACPKCKQEVRVPKGKGKIAITCPKCHEKFVKKT